MTFEELQKANSFVNTIDMVRRDKKTGAVITKQYAEVNQRIKAFRFLYPNGCILTDMVSNENGVCIFRAHVIDEEGHTLGTGTAYEKEGSTMINQTSYIENCETSAVGRALAMCGIGIDTSIASMDEVATAIANQEEAEKPKTQPKQARKVRSKEEPVQDAETPKTAVQRVGEYITRNGLSSKYVESLCNHYGVTTFAELTEEQATDYIECMKQKGKEI